MFGDFISFIPQLKKWIADNDADYWMFFSGVEGVGKSNSCIATALMLEGKNFGVNNIHFQPKPFIHALSTSKNTTIVADEGVNVLFSRNAMQKENKSSIREIIVDRYLNNIVIVNSPRVKYIDLDIRDHRIHLLGVCFARNGVKGHTFFFRGSKVNKVSRFFDETEQFSYSNEDTIKALYREVTPDLYVQFPSLATCPELAPVWNPYLKKKEQNHKDLYAEVESGDKKEKKRTGFQ